MPRPSRRDDVLRAASARFYRHGVTATGVDAVIADAGVAKMTLYGNFGSKDDLVVAYLAERDRRFFERLDQEVARQDTPLARALAPVTLYRTYLDEEGFHGCAFVNASAELPPEHPGHQVITANKQQMRRRWCELIAELGLTSPEAVAEECFLLLEGAYVHAGMGLGTKPLDTAEAAIRRRLCPPR